MDDQELFDEIIWVMKNYGSDAGERADPGSKLRVQARRIVEFVRQRSEAYGLFNQHNIELLRPVSTLSRRSDYAKGD